MRSGERRLTRTLNLKLLVSSCLVLMVLASVGFVLHRYRQEELASLLAQRADRLAEAGELSKANFYLQKYLTLSPNDLQARLKLIDIADRLAAQGAGRSYLIRLLAETIGLPDEGLEADRPRLRVMLAEQLFLNEQYHGALDQIDTLERQGPIGPDARRVKALATLGLIPARGSLLESTRQAKLGEVLPLLEEASDHAPGDATLALAVAQTYREYPSLAQNQEQSNRIADDRIDRMVARRAGESDAYVIRYRYRKRNDIDGAVDDLRAALEITPDHYESNLLLGGELLQQIERGDRSDADSVAEAKRLFRTAIESAPSSPGAYYLLARLHWHVGEQSDAIALLRDADRSIDRRSLEISFLLANYLLSEGQLDQASDLVASLREAIHAPGTGATTNGLALMNNRLRLLEARLSSGRGDVSTALTYYSTVANLSNEHQWEEDAAAVLNREASQEMAQLLVGLGRWDQVAQKLVEVANQLEAEIAPIAPNGNGKRQLVAPVTLEGEHRAARIQAAEAYLRAGQYADAVQQLEIIAEYTDSREKTLPREALETRLLAELSVQLDALPANRSWEEFEFLAARATAELPNSERVALALIQHSLAQAREGVRSGSDVRTEIQRLTEQFPSSPRVWWIAVNGYLGIGELLSAEEAVDRYLTIEPVEELRVSRRVAFLVGAGRVLEARNWVAARLVDADAEERPLLRRLEIRLLATEEQSDLALAKAKELAHASSDKESLKLAWGVAIDGQDWELAREIEQSLSKASEVTHDELDYYRAERMLASFDLLSSDQRDELHRIIGRVRSERPNWGQGAVMEARLAESRGDDEAAVQSYQLAVALGNRSTSTLERLTLHLFRNGRYEEAQEVIDRLRSTMGVLSRHTESLAINTALKQDRLSDAKNLALKSVAEHPDDPARKLWLHHVLMLNGESGEAEIVLAEAADEFPDSEILWKARLAHLARTNRRDEALELMESLPRSLQQDTLGRSLALASGYEVLGEFTRARTFYQQALEVSPRNEAARLRYANLLLKSDAVAAQEQFEEVLRLHPENAEARRKLAALLAATGEPSAWQRIDGLLAAAEDSSGHLDKRLRAILLSKRGKTTEERAEYCALARRILLEIVESSDYSGDDIDRLLLAGTYEQEGLLSDDPTYFELARSQLSYLRSRVDGNEKYAVLYLGFLLRSIDALKTMENAESVREAFIRDARSVLEDRGRSIAASDAAGPMDRLTLLGLRARLLKSEGKLDEAQSVIQDYASQELSNEGDKSIRARLVLGLGAIYSSIGAHAEAEPWYRELMKTAPGAELLVSKSLFQQGRSSDAVKLFLDGQESVLSPTRAATLASLLSVSNTDASAFEEAWPAVSGALEKHKDDVDLLISVAVLEVTRGNQQEAIRLFRRVLGSDPDNTLALNNLATLLGEREADRKEALRLISHAMRVSGRSPALLDTQGTIQLQSGRAEDAISSLEESVASVDVDPRYYFHLAAAYWRGGKPDKAMDALEEARRRGLDKTVLTTADRDLMRELEAGLGVARRTGKEAA
ncbi:tetratricopeptide repeat protein [Posidoniimonas corsicana]|nr:tetratricopeptide repeat protein [Posidoniimonas corsicana]